MLGMKRALLVAPLLFFTAACGGEEEPSAASQPEPTESQSASPEIEPAATADQWASVIAQYAPDDETLQQPMDECDFFQLGPPDSPLCNISVTTLHYAANALAGQIDVAVSEIGEPPEEMTRLVTDTQEAAQDLADATGEVVDGKCFNKRAARDECFSPRAQTMRTTSALENVLAGWTPYL